MHSGPIGAAWMMDCWGHRDPPNAIGGILAAGIPKQYSYQTCWWCDSFTCNMSASARMIFPNDTYVCCSNVYVALCPRMNLSGYIMLISAEYISQLNNQWQVRLGQQWYKKVISSRPLVIPSPLFLAGYKVLFIWKPVRMLMQWCRARTRIWSNLRLSLGQLKKHGHIIQYPNCILRSEIVKYVIYVFASSGEWLFPWGHLEAQRWKWQCPFGGI